MSLTATEPIPITHGGDFYVPQFEVVLGNRRASGAILRDVVQVKYTDSLQAIDSFELTINNWCAEKRKFKYSDQRLFDPGTPVELSMGYMGAAGGGLRTMLRGDITELRPSFPAGGQPNLVVCGQNILHNFRSEQKNEIHKEPRYADIARKICGRMKVEFVELPGSNAGVNQDEIKQDNEYDIMFLLRLARMAGYDLIVVEKGQVAALAFGPPDASALPTYKLQYGRTLIEFQPKISFAHQVDKVVVRGWDVAKGIPIDVTVGGGSLKDKIQKGAKNPVEARKEVIGHQPVKNAQAARELAKAKLTEIQNEAVTASGSVVGLPDLRTGSQVHISGVGRRFNGSYFVTGTTHSLGSGGYTTQFECRLDALSNVGDEALQDGGRA